MTTQPAYDRPPSLPTRLYRRGVKPMLVRFRLGTAGPCLRLRFNGEGMGFFAQMSACLHFFRHGEARGFSPVVELPSPNYLATGMGDNWFEYFFELRNPPSPEAIRRAASLTIGNIDELPAFADDLRLDEARSLFFRHVGIRDEFERSLAAFCGDNGIGERTVGVHYRGTDKSDEAALPGYEAAFLAVEDVLRARPETDSIFIASDEQTFFERSRERFAGLRVVTFEDSVRSVDGTPVHLGERSAGNYLMGRDALLNALILSRCAVLVRSTSFLSAWSSIFNPAARVVLLNAPFDGKLWYPEREIMKRATLAFGSSAAGPRP